MAFPVTIPNTFSNATSSIPLSQLDNNFTTLVTALNGVANGAETLANVSITGGNISNVTLDNVTVDVETLSNVTITNLTVDGTANLTNSTVTANLATITTANVTTVNATTVDTTNIEVTNIKAKDGTASATIADTTGYWTFSGTGAFTTPKGTTGEQPGTPVTGMLRYNTTSNEFEGYSGSSPSWKSVGGAAISNDTSTSSNVYPAFLNATSGTASTVYTSNAKLLYKPSTGELQASEMVATNGIVVNSQTVSADYTIPSGSNAMSAGPVTVDSGVTVTVSSGSVWTVI